MPPEYMVQQQAALQQQQQLLLQQQYLMHQHMVQQQQQRVGPMRSARSANACISLSCPCCMAQERGPGSAVIMSERPLATPDDTLLRESFICLLGKGLKLYGPPQDPELEINFPGCAMQYMGAGWSGQYSEGHPGLHSMPMVPSWYHVPGRELSLALQ